MLKAPVGKFARTEPMGSGAGAHRELQPDDLVLMTLADI